jgi:hypothetical protein
MEKVHKPNSVCYTPSSEPFRIYYMLYNVSIKHDFKKKTTIKLTVVCKFLPYGFTLLAINLAPYGEGQWDVIGSSCLSL